MPRSRPKLHCELLHRAPVLTSGWTVEVASAPTGRSCAGDGVGKFEPSREEVYEVGTGDTISRLRRRWAGHLYENQERAARDWAGLAASAFASGGQPGQPNCVRHRHRRLPSPVRGPHHPHSSSAEGCREPGSLTGDVQDQGTADPAFGAGHLGDEVGHLAAEDGPAHAMAVAMRASRALSAPRSALGSRPMGEARRTCGLGAGRLAGATRTPCGGKPPPRGAGGLATVSHSSVTGGRTGIGSGSRGPRSHPSR